jgi:hypothetical protein
MREGPVAACALISDCRSAAPVAPYPASQLGGDQTPSAGPPAAQSSEAASLVRRQ